MNDNPEIVPDWMTECEVQRYLIWLDTPPEPYSPSNNSE